MSSLLTFMIMLLMPFAYGSNGKNKNINYETEITLTQNDIDSRIVKILRKELDPHNIKYANLNDQQILKLIINQYEGKKENDESSYLQYSRYLLYQQFIFYRHSSKDFSKSLFDFQLSHFSDELNFVSDSLGISVANFNQSQNPIRVEIVNTYSDQLKKLFSSIKHINFKNEEFPQALWPEKNNSYKMANMNLRLYAFCKLNYIGHGQVCRSFMRLYKMLDVSQSQRGRSHSGILTMPKYLKVFAQREIVKPVLEVAIKLLEIRRELDLKVPSYSIYDLFIRSFKKYGFNQKQANKITIDIMSYYGQRGASFSYSATYWFEKYFRSHQGYPVTMLNTLNLSLIFSAISMIDKYTFEKNQRHFSLPTSIKSEFLVGKPYYFWMSVMLARDLKRKYPSTPVKAIVKTVQLFNQAYQLRANGTDFNHRRPGILADKFQNHAIKMDMTVGLTGSLWALSPKEYTMDRVLKRVFSKSDDTSENDKDFRVTDKKQVYSQLKHNKNWVKVFRPKTAIRELFKQH